ncbi:cation:proton antiporter [Candidatus Bathyarchaeota archaeon]|nr:cation:proton antiporter [Candidatus Bathyarchaeota archaeon]
MDYLPLFLIWIAAAFLLPEMLRKFRIPWVTAVIFTGMLLGPYGLGVIHPEEAMIFLSSLGLIFLMFTAGLDTKISFLREAGKETVFYTVLNFCVPFATGCLLGIGLGLDVFASLILGTCFSSSSVGIIIPLLKELEVESKIKSTITATIFIEDVTSLVLLAILLQAKTPISPIPLPLFPIALLFFLAIIFILIPRLQGIFLRLGKSDVFGAELRSVLLTLALVSFMAELIGVHAMVGGFLAGLTLSNLLGKREELGKKILSISYRFLIPIFLLNLGLTTDIKLLFSPKDAVLACLVIVSLIASKVLGGFLGARIAKFPLKTSLGMVL